MRQGGEPQGVQVVRQGEPTPYHCHFNPLYVHTQTHKKSISAPLSVAVGIRTHAFPILGSSEQKSSLKILSGCLYIMIIYPPVRKMPQKPNLRQLPNCRRTTAHGFFRMCRPI